MNKWKIIQIRTRKRIKDKNGNYIKDFDTAHDAIKYIQDKLGNSPYLTVARIGKRKPRDGYQTKLGNK